MHSARLDRPRLPRVIDHVLRQRDDTRSAVHDELRGQLIGWIVPNCERPEPIVVLSPKATILIVWANAQFGMTNTFNAPMQTT